ncbi:hypothetical protein V1502_06055 [Bacillus sp. SCS-153A]|uniref:WYL domain-containing protein n=1 Tax=Rossellomorea sedimentorum TaxID=3115294 RepID=UPI0039062ADA
MERTLRKAWHNKTPIQIIYKNEEDHFTKRTILITKMEHEHIHAYCYLRQHFRTFRKQNIFAAFPATKYNDQQGLSS